MSSIAVNSKIHIHVLRDLSTCCLPLQNPNARIFDIYQIQSQSLLSRTSGDVLTHIACFLSLADLNSTGHTCKFLHNICLKPCIWKMWVERLEIPLPFLEAPQVNPNILSPKKRLKVDFSALTKHPFCRVKDYFMERLVACLNKALRPTPVFTIKESHVGLVRLVESQKNFLAAHIPSFIAHDLKIFIKTILTSSEITEQIRGEAVYYAAYLNKCAIVQMLLNNGAISKSARGYAAKYAAMFGYLDILHLLLKNGDGISDESREEAFIDAATTGLLDTVQILLSSGPVAEHALKQAAAESVKRSQYDTLQVIIDHGVATAPDIIGTALVAAVDVNDLPCVQLLLSFGDIASEDLEDARACALSKGHEQILQLLT